MDLDCQFWESLLAEFSSYEAKCNELDEQAKAFPDPLIASGEHDILPEDCIMETLPTVGPNDSEWQNFVDYFGPTGSTPQCQTDLTLGGNVATGSTPATLGTIPQFQEPLSTLPTYLSSVASSSHSTPQPFPDNTAFLYSYLADTSEPVHQSLNGDSFGTVAGSSNLQRAPSQPAIQEAPQLEWGTTVASSPVNAMACAPIVRSPSMSHSSSNVGQEFGKDKRVDSAYLQGVSDLESPTGCSDPTSNNATTTTAGLLTSYFGAGWDHFDQVLEPPSPDDWNVFWQQFDSLEQPNATSGETETATAISREKHCRNHSTGTASSSSSLDVHVASPDTPLPQVEFDCFTGPMVVPPGKEPHPHAHLAILHVHRLRKPSSPCSVSPEVPPVYDPSGTRYANLVWNPTCPKLKQQRWQYWSRKLRTNPSQRKSKNPQMFRCGECGEAFSRHAELDRHWRKSCKLREIIEWIQCIQCGHTIAARDDGFVRHVRSCKVPEKYWKGRS